MIVILSIKRRSLWGASKIDEKKLQYWKSGPDLLLEVLMTYSAHTVSRRIIDDSIFS